MSYHRSKFVKRTKRSYSPLSGAVESFMNLFTTPPITPISPTASAPSTTWSPTTADQKTKAAAGCTPLEIVASPGTSPYIACQQKLQKAASSSSGGIASDAAKLLGALIGNAVNPTPAQPMIAAAPSSGISTTTAVVGAAALVGVLYFALKD